MTEKENLFSEDGKETGTEKEGGEPSGTEALVGAGDEAGELISKWVGDNKKFSSVDQLVESYDNSQAFIEQLKQENADMRRELTNAEKLDQILDRIEASGSQSANRRGEGPPKETPSGGTGQESGASEKTNEELISEAVQREMTRIESQRTATQNLDSASDQLLELAGNDRDQAKRMLKKTAGELGVSVQYLQQQAEVSPSAFLRMVSSTEPEGTGGAPSGAGGSSHNSQAFERDSFRSPDGEVQPWSHWRKMKGQMTKAEFYSPSVQNRIFKSRQELGDKFFDVT